MKMQIRSLVNFYTLLLIREYPKHGYELMKELEKQLGRKVNTSQVYQFLLALKKKEFISSEKNGDRRKVYRPTKGGCRVYRQIPARLFHTAPSISKRIYYKIEWSRKKNYTRRL